LQYISATTFHQLCKLFPEFTQRFINELSSDYSCNLWELHKPVDERENFNNFKRKNSQIPSVTGTKVNREYMMIFLVSEAVGKNEKASDSYEDEILKEDGSDQEIMPLLDELSGWSPEIETQKSDDDSSSLFAPDTNSAERLRWFSDPLTLERKSSKKVTWSDDCSRRSR
jgi:hypothetical protein